MKNTRSVLLGLVFTIFTTVNSAQAAILGPTFPLPGGTDFSFSGDSGRSGGASLNLFNFDETQWNQAWWGPANVGLSLDGSGISGGEVMSLVSTTGTTAVWQGSSFISLSSSSPAVDTRFTAIINTGGGNWLTNPGDIALPVSDPFAVSEITGDPWQVDYIFEARFSNTGAYEPYLDFFDAQQTAPSALTQSNFDGQLFYSPVPIPAAVWLFGSGLLGLISIARKKAA
jgi:hypothetical protein